MTNLILRQRRSGTVRVSLKACCLVLFVLFWAAPAWAKDVTWTEVKTKMMSADGYSMNYDYDGSEGTYRFHYVVQGDGAKILTEVLEGSARGAGTRILYDPSVDKENVSMKTHMLTLRRSLTAADIKDSSLYQPLFRQLVEELVAPEPAGTLKGPGGSLIFLFGDKAGVQDRLEVGPNGDPVSMRRLDQSREVKKFTFRDLAWGATTITWP